MPNRILRRGLRGSVLKAKTSILAVPAKPYSGLEPAVYRFRTPPIIAAVLEAISAGASCDGIVDSLHPPITEAATATDSSNGLVPLTQGAGYFGGNQGNYATIVRFNLANAANDNTSAALALARSSATGIAAEYFGYFCGGNSGTVSAEIDGIDFITEAAINPAAAMPAGTQQAAGAANYTRGFVAGGQIAAGTPLATVQTFLFSTMARTQLSGALAKARYDFSGISGTTNGYFAGGVDVSFISQTEIDGVLFTGSITNTASVLTGARYGVATLSSPATSGKGYFCGGTNGTRFSQIDSLLFSTEAMAVESYGLVTARSQAGGVQSPTQGYTCGGNTGSNSYEIDGIDFTTNTATNSSVVMATSVLYTGSVSARQFGIQAVAITEGATATDSLVGDYANMRSQDESAVAVVLQDAIKNAKYADIVATTARESRSLFFCGGDDYQGDPSAPNYGTLNYISRIEVFTDTFYPCGGALTQRRESSAGAASSTKGYVIAGLHPNGTMGWVWQVTDALRFSDETVTAVSSTMNVSQAGVSASASATAAYARGKQGIGDYNKLDFSTETFSVLGWHPSVMKGYAAALDSATKGYCCGGILDVGGTNTDAIDAIVFSTETASTVTAVLPHANANMGAVSSGLKGFTVGGGIVGSNLVNALTFSTETVVDMGAMTDVVRATAGASSSSHGYVTGGGWASGDVLSTVRKFSYATESFVSNSATIRTAQNHCGFAAPGTTIGCMDVIASHINATRDIVESANATAAMLGVVAGVQVEHASAIDTIDTLGMVMGALQHEFAWLQSFSTGTKNLPTVSVTEMLTAVAQQSAGFYFSNAITAQTAATSSHSAFALAVVNQAAAAAADVLNTAVLGKLGVRLEPVVAVTVSAAAQSGASGVAEVATARSNESVIADFKSAIHEAVSAWVSVRLDPASLDQPQYSVTIKTKTGSERVFTGREVAIVTSAISGDQFVSIDQESAHVR